MPNEPRFIELMLAHQPGEAPRTIHVNVNFIVVFHAVNPSVDVLSTSEWKLIPANALTRLVYGDDNAFNSVLLTQTPAQIKALLEAK